MQSILIIDDNEDIRSLLADFLGSGGFEVVDAKDGEAGLEALRQGWKEMERGQAASHAAPARAPAGVGMAVQA